MIPTSFRQGVLPLGFCLNIWEPQAVVPGDGGRCCFHGPNPMAPLPAPVALVAVVVPGPHHWKWVGPLLWDQNSGSGLIAGPLCSPHRHCSRGSGQWGSEMSWREETGKRGREE